MGFKQTAVTALLLVAVITSGAMACCGHCHGGHGGHGMHKSKTVLSQQDSVAVEKFTANNEDLIAKLKNNKEQIKAEYEQKNPDYDKIAELKKKGVDYHTELEKRAAKKELKHHKCWCPMHQ